MPVTIQDDPTQFPSVSAPVRGDPRSSASVATPFQQLANRTANLLARLNAVLAVGDNGVRAVRSLSSVASLVASTDHVDGQLVRVVGVGVYEFIAASTSSLASPVCITPADVAAAASAGRWLLVNVGASGGPNGPALLDSTGKIPTRLAGVSSARPTGARDAVWATVPGGDATFSDLPQLAVTATCAVGDLLDITSTIMSRTQGVSADDNADFQIVVTDGGTDYVLADSAVHFGVCPEQITLCAVYSVTHAGNVPVRVQASANTDNGLVLRMPSNLTVRHFQS